MVEIHVIRTTRVPPDAVLGTLRDPSPETRGKYWSNVTSERFELHDSGPGFLEVTEGTFVAGVFWERSRYEWPTADCVTATVLASNVFKPGSTFEVRATREDSETRVEMTIRREFQPGVKGRIAAAVNHLGGRRLFGWYLGTSLKALERDAAGS